MRLRDVAERAGVSTATVARVIHGNGPVAPATRERVEEVLSETGYRINAIAQGLRVRRTRTIGHLLQDIDPNPFYARVALGLEAAATRGSHQVLLFNARGSAALEREGVEAFVQRQVDAIVFTTPVDAANVTYALSAGSRVVEVERPTLAVTHTVTVDNRSGARQAIEHLAALGHRRIGFVGARPADARAPVGPGDVDGERFAGYCDGMRTHGLEVHDELLVLDRYAPEHDRHSFGDGYEYAARLLGGDDPPSAVLVASDLLAAGVLQWLYERGARVPDDVSVIGFDDTYAQHLAPPLSSVRLPMLELGEVAAQLALDDRQDGAVHRRLETALVVRSSTGPS
jgi:DNA-binding LacI/PurR family transcriptional regulator